MKKRKNYSSFSEYITNRGKVLEKPPTETLPDYKGPHKKKPDAAKAKGKNWEVGGGKSAGGGGNYATTAKSRPAQKPESGGFGHMGDKKMVYQPSGKGGKKTKSDEWLAKGDKKLIYSPVTTETFLNQTKSMNTAQFAKHVKKSLTENCVDKKAPQVTAYSVGAFHPDPIQAIKYVTYLANENAHLCRALVREAKRYGCVNKLLGEMLSMPETFTTLASVIDGKHGEVFTRRLERALLESRAGHKRRSNITEDVDKPAHNDDEHVDDEDKDKSEDDELDLGDGDDEHKGGDDEHKDDDDEHKDDGDDDQSGEKLDLGDGDGDGDDDTHATHNDDDMNLDDDDDTPPPAPSDDDDDTPPPVPSDDEEDQGDGDDQLKFGDEDDDEDDDDDDDKDHLDLDDDEDNDDNSDDDDDDDEDHLGLDDEGDKDEDQPHPHHKRKMPWE